MAGKPVSLLTGYHRSWFRGDLLAGVTVTAYLIPQVMAYAELAGLPAVTGLWAAAGALLGYAFVGSSRVLSVGPESTTALMTAAVLGASPAASANPAAFAAALALMVALICLLGWFVGFSAFADLLSRPVLVGYMTGIAVVMVVSQLDRLTGTTASGDSTGADLVSLVENIDGVHAPTLALGLATLAVLLLGSWAFPRAPVALIGMLGAAGVSVLLDLPGAGVEVIGTIPTGLPMPAVPAVGLGDVAGLVLPALGVALVGYTDNVLTARSFADRRQEAIDPRRELLGLGLANIGSGLMHGFPVSSSGSRTAIADAVGARSQVTSLVTLAATVAAIFTMGPVLAAFPSAALGAVVVYAAVRLIEIAELRRFAAFRRSELLLCVATIAAVLVLGVLQGVLIAIVLSVLDLLRRVARPHDAVEGTVPGVAGMHDIDDYPLAQQVPGLVVYRYDSPLFFANAGDFLRRAVRAVDGAQQPVRWLVLNTEAMVEVDITAADALETLRRQMTERGVTLALARVKQDLRDELKPTGLLDRIGADRIFPTLPMAVSAYESSQR
ncbi:MULTISPECIES: SulP family inorganic anion transporter [unclassified Nocardioides]|uniref:SulP family inorganic anion transporter n=1 Tax=unclassified Nocardioides TaxID=2615069 RepID=UPI0007033D9F|nr:MULTISPECIES: SulP family inorganic anion transporter [unclassified Nocardioides]KQZ70345.1 sulfate transporter [Nocardioides sp. Root151]KRF18205.1 sulfate transporter [Nocardioides sp. Soil796]